MSRLEAAIEKRIDDGKYYDAHQMIKTIISRQCTKNEFQDAIDTCLRFSLVFASAEQYELAADLGNIAIDTAINGAKVRKEEPYKQFATPEIQDVILTINAEIPANATRERVKFLESAIRASKGEESKRGHPFYHNLLGRVHLQESRPGNAVLHLVLCDGGDNMEIIEAMTAAVEAVYPSERDLFILRTILILLTLEKIDVARAIVKQFMNGDETPGVCFQFAYLATEAAAAKDLAFFDEIKEKYQLIFRRDSQLHSFIEATERTMGRQKSQPTGLAALFGSLFG